LLRVAVGVPSHDVWNAEFGIAFGRLLIYASRMPFGGQPVDVGLLYARGSILPSNRNKIVRNAIDKKFEHLLFLDCDMDFPPDTLHRLLAHGKDVVAANYVKRQLPGKPVSVSGGKPVVSAPDRHGLEIVDGAGTGLMLVRTSLFSRIPPPAFAFEPIPGNPVEFLGEDYYFCAKLKAAGIAVHIDHDLSREVSHIGNFHYRMSHAAESRQP